MKIRFDDGTLVVESNENPNFGRLDGSVGIHPPANLAGFVYDGRVDALRAPAIHYRRFLEQSAGWGALQEDPLAQAMGIGEGLAKTLGRAQRFLAESAQEGLRGYQRVALQRWLAAGGRGLVVLPTGAGKTRTALHAIRAMGVPTLCLVPTRVLLAQWKKELEREHRSGPIGQLGDGVRDIRKITLATFASARNLAPLHGLRFALLIVDEAHHFGHSAYDEALVMSAAPFRLALTATPPDDPEKRKRLCALVGQELTRLSVGDLIGVHLSAIKHDVTLVPLSAGQRAAYERLYGAYQSQRKILIKRGLKSTQRAFMTTASGRRALAARRSAVHILKTNVALEDALIRTVSLHCQRRLIIFAADSEQALRLAHLLLAPVVLAEVGKAEREAVLSAFKKGTIRVLITCKVLNEGYDLPETEGVVLVGGRRSSGETLQRIGRALRKSAGKTAMVFELATAGTHEERAARIPIEGLPKPHFKFCYAEQGQIQPRVGCEVNIAGPRYVE